MTLAQSRDAPVFALSVAKLFDVSIGGLPAGWKLPPLMTRSPESTITPATSGCWPHWSMPLMTPVPFLSRPDKLSHAAATLIVAVFHVAYMPTVRSAAVA